ncbi:MAG: chemotaxis protein CheW [Defluviitaleaceae bacterium]|nr:chemotaxis protein CheW [Defluviitaleaceae bacterium]
MLEDATLINDGFITDTIKNKFLLFKIGEEEFGVEISLVREIINMGNITVVPHTPHYLKGIMNLRGEIVPILEIRSRFMMEEIPYDDLTCIIIIEHGSDKIGLVVDEVNEVKYIDEEKIASPPSAKLSYANYFVKNLGHTDNGVALLLEIDKLLYDE